MPHAVLYRQAVLHALFRWHAPALSHSDNLLYNMVASFTPSARDRAPHQLWSSPLRWALGTRRYGMLKLRGAKGEGESHWNSELGTQIVKPSAPPPRQSCSCLCCGILVALLLCANLITMAPVLFQSEGGGTVLQVSVALGPQTGGQGRERSASNLFSDPLDHVDVSQSNAVGKNKLARPWQPAGGAAVAPRRIRRHNDDQLNDEPNLINLGWAATPRFNNDEDQGAASEQGASTASSASHASSASSIPTTPSTTSASAGSSASAASAASRSCNHIRGGS